MGQLAITPYLAPTNRLQPNASAAGSRAQMITQPYPQLMAPTPVMPSQAVGGMANQSVATIRAMAAQASDKPVTQRTNDDWYWIFQNSKLGEPLTPPAIPTPQSGRQDMNNAVTGQLANYEAPPAAAAAAAPAASPGITIDDLQRMRDDPNSSQMYEGPIPGEGQPDTAYRGDNALPGIPSQAEGRSQLDTAIDDRMASVDDASAPSATPIWNPYTGTRDPAPPAQQPDQPADYTPEDSWTKRPISESVMPFLSRVFVPPAARGLQPTNQILPDDPYHMGPSENGAGVPAPAPAADTAPSGDTGVLSSIIGALTGKGGAPAADAAAAAAPAAGQLSTDAGSPAAGATDGSQLSTDVKPGVKPAPPSLEQTVAQAASGTITPPDHVKSADLEVKPSDMGDREGIEAQQFPGAINPKTAAVAAQVATAPAQQVSGNLSTLEKLLSEPAVTPAELEQQRQARNSFALLVTGLGIMKAASKPGATGLGAFGEGGLQGVGMLYRMKKDDEAKNALLTNQRLQRAKLYYDVDKDQKELAMKGAELNEKIRHDTASDSEIASYHKDEIAVRNREVRVKEMEAGPGGTKGIERDQKVLNFAQDYAKNDAASYKKAEDGSIAMELDMLGNKKPEIDPTLYEQNVHKHLDRLNKQYGTSVGYPDSATLSASVPLPMPKSQSDLKVGTVYNNGKGQKGKWNGTNFELVP